MPAGPSAAPTLGSHLLAPHLPPSLGVPSCPGLGVSLSPCTEVAWSREWEEEPGRLTAPPAQAPRDAQQDTTRAGTEACRDGSQECSGDASQLLAALRRRWEGTKRLLAVAGMAPAGARAAVGPQFLPGGSRAANSVGVPAVLAAAEASGMQQGQSQPRGQSRLPAQPWHCQGAKCARAGAVGLLSLLLSPSPHGLPSAQLPLASWLVPVEREEHPWVPPVCVPLG